MMAKIATTWQLNRQVDAITAATMGNVVAATSSLTGSVWDGQVLGLISNGTTETEFKVECGMADLCAAAGEGYFIAACDDGCLRLIHMEGVLVLPSGHDDCATSVSMAPGKEKLVASGGLDAAVMLWDLEEPQKKPSRFEAHKDAVNSVEWTTPSTLVTASSDGTASLWDMRERTLRPSLSIRVGPIVYTAACSSETRIMLSTERCDIAAYDIRMGQTMQGLWTIDALNGPVRRIRPCPYDESLCAAGTDSPSTLVFNPQNGARKLELHHHTDFVRGIAWNPETSGVLYCGSWDKTVSMIKLDI